MRRSDGAMDGNFVAAEGMEPSEVTLVYIIPAAIRAQAGLAQLSTPAWPQCRNGMRVVRQPPACDLISFTGTGKAMPHFGKAHSISCSRTLSAMTRKSMDFAVIVKRREPASQIRHGENPYRHWQPERGARRGDVVYSAVSREQDRVIDVGMALALRTGFSAVA
jgi:hypothetical protein